MSVGTYFCRAQSKVMCNKCTADCVRFLVQNETAIYTSVWGAQSAHSGSECLKIGQKGKNEEFTSIAKIINLATSGFRFLSPNLFVPLDVFLELINWL